MGRSRMTVLSGAVSVVVLVAMILTTGSRAFATSTGIPDVNGCFANVADPHVSTGAGGVIAKISITCDGVSAYFEYNNYLYLCPTPPPSSAMQQIPDGGSGGPRSGDDSPYNWYYANCSLMSKDIGTIPDPAPGLVYTRYIPPLGQPGATGSGYWVAIDWWNSADASGFCDGGGQTFSNAVPITYP